MRRDIGSGRIVAGASSEPLTPCARRGPVAVADGIRDADDRLDRVLTCDPVSASSAMRTPAIPKLATAAARANIDMPMGTPGGVEAMIIPERPALERRVLDGTGRDCRRCRRHGGTSPGRPRRLRHRPHLAAAAAARSARPQRRQYIDVERIATTPERSSASIPRLLAAPVRTPRPPRRQRAGRARGVRCGARLARHQAAAPTGGAGHVPARRVPRAAHLRELPGPALGAARFDRRPRRRAATASC